MTSSTMFEKYQEQLKTLPDKDLIGDVLTFEFRQPRTTRDDLVTWFAELGLDESYIPPEIKTIDAYKRATGEMAKSNYDLAGGKTAALFVRNVSGDGDRVIRRIVREIRDPKGKKLDYHEVGEAVFYKASRKGKNTTGGTSVKFTLLERNLGANEVPYVQEFIKKMESDYRFFAMYYHTQAIRDMVRNYVLGLNSISLRSSGGVYFVHKSRRQTLLKIAELINGKVDHGCRIHMMPLVDAGYQREMLTEAFQDQVEKSCDKLLTKVAQINEKYKGKSVPPSQFAELQEAYNETLSSTEEYTRVLGLAQGRAGTALELAMDSIADVAARLEVAS